MSNHLCDTVLDLQLESLIFTTQKHLYFLYYNKCSM